MNNIYINEATGQKIKLYKQQIIHVYDHEDSRDILDFRDTAEGVAQWCMENLFGDEDNIDDIEEAFQKERWLDVVELTQCRNCDYEVEDEWVVEELEEKAS